jgi:hypothetical protein
MSQLSGAAARRLLMHGCTGIGRLVLDTGRKGSSETDCQPVHISSIKLLTADTAQVGLHGAMLRLS